MTFKEGDNLLDLSDEDFEKLNPSEFDFTTESANTDDEPDSESDDSEGDGDEGEEADPQVEDEDKVLEKVKEGEPTKEVEPEKETTTEEAVDYKAKYDALMSSFKANGVEMTPKSEEDARRLMQMGANYNKKMAGMKPAMKILKTLENNNLLSEGELDFLIDLKNGNQDAIAKLISQHKIDPLEVDLTTDLSMYQLITLQAMLKSTWMQYLMKFKILPHSVKLLMSLQRDGTKPVNRKQVLIRKSLK